MKKELPKRLTKRSSRKMARHTRDYQWKFMERVNQHDPLWFCAWNKDHRWETKEDEWRDCLFGGMDILEWIQAHKDWFKVGRWSNKRNAVPVRLTDAGRKALTEKEKYDMEDVTGGLVEPGYIVKPLPPSKRRRKANGAM